MATIQKDPVHTYEEGLLELYKKIRPGEPLAVDSAESLIMSMFFDPRRYDLAKVGRYKFNKKLMLRNRITGHVLAEDVVDTQTGEILAEAGTEVTRELADEIQKRTGGEVRVTVPGHTQRGGSPCPYDRVFASRLGAEAGELILKGEYGFMVGYKNREIVKVPLADVAGKLKMVSPDSDIVKEAKLLGISFGD